MAMAPSFFGKREPGTPTQRPTTPGPTGSGYGSASNTTAQSVQPAQPVQATPAGAGQMATNSSSASAPAATEGGSKLTVGPNIKLKGVEITDCDTLVVEGMVEATMDSRVIQISERGAFKGSAEIDIAVTDDR